MAHRMIDTHIHAWDLSRARYTWLEGDTTLLNRTYTTEELDPQRAAAGVTEGVLVQAANNFEDTDLMLEKASGADWITGVVGWLPLTDPEATEKQLTEKYLRHPYFKGIRHLIHDEADPAWLLQEKVIESLKIIAQYHLPYDVVGILPEHIETALKVAEKVPELNMVFDHLNRPPVGEGKISGHWSERMQEAARHPNFYAKISGLGTIAGKGNDWSAEDILPAVEFALQHFGEDRCFLGGDWPVSLLAGSYAHTWMIYHHVISDLLNEAAQKKVFYQNAIQFYHL